MAADKQITLSVHPISSNDTAAGHLEPGDPAEAPWCAFVANTVLERRCL